VSVSASVSASEGRCPYKPDTDTDADTTI
jgi:hypothetical protein